jgi:plastocyanin
MAPLIGKASSGAVRRALVLATTLTLLFGPTASAQDGAASAATGQTYKVRIVDFDYRPSRVTVNVGDTVQWTNSARTNHTATHENRRVFDSLVLEPGAAFSHTFTETGVVRYFCMLHPWMTAAVTVVRSGAPSPEDQATDAAPSSTGAGGYQLRALPYRSYGSYIGSGGLPAFAYPYYLGYGLGYPYYGSPLGGYGPFGYPFYGAGYGGYGYGGYGYGGYGGYGYGGYGYPYGYGY